jgi:hypothetical protein
MIRSKFELNENEVKAAEKFIAKLPKRYKNESKKMIFDFGNGIGIGVSIKVGDREKNITDYNTW